MAAMQSPEESGLWWKLTSILGGLALALATWIWNHVTGTLTGRITKLEATMETKATTAEMDRERRSIELVFEKIDQLKDDMNRKHVELVRAIERGGTRRDEA